MAQLELWLDHYDELFSDFDSRNYLKRRISADFLDELRTLFESKDENIDVLELQVPAAMRQQETEQLIVKNLSLYTLHQFQNKHQQYRKRKFNGLLLLSLGSLLTILNVLISHYFNPLSFGLQSLKVLLEPASWFLLWTSMDLLFYGLKKIKAEQIFFKKLSRVNWCFRSL